MPYQPASDALKHITVLDLTRVRSGPTCVRQLGDWGANVIKVETPEAVEGDGALGAGRNTGDFQNLQRNKRSITINLKDPDGSKVLMKLAANADVVVENYRPDVKERLGFDYESLKAINPRIILASISGFGQDGPYAKRPGFDQIAQGMGGLMSITGEPGKGPMRVGIPVADLTAGLFCALGILVALFERVQSGEGQWVQSSLLQAQTFMLDFQAARYLMENEVAGQAGNDHPTSIPTGVFPTSDGNINIAIAGGTDYRGVNQDYTGIANIEGMDEALANMALLKSAFTIEVPTTGIAMSAAALENAEGQGGGTAIVTTDNSDSSVSTHSQTIITTPQVDKTTMVMQR